MSPWITFDVPFCFQCLYLYMSSFLNAVAHLRPVNSDRKSLAGAPPILTQEVSLFSGCP